MTAYLFLLLQHVLPRYLMTSVIYRLARIRIPKIKNWMIGTFIRRFDVDVDEIALDVPDHFPTFNAFFTRELKPGTRPIDASPDSIISPVDGTVSAAGRIEHDQLLQAKGLTYTLADLLATDLDDTEVFANGHFVTLYLAPYNYHRVHSPLPGRLTAARYIPGELFSVNASTVSLLPRLFTRNERLVCRLETDAGPLALILVGALNVGSISTVWTGEIRPRKKGVVEDLTPAKHAAAREVAKGDLIGWFNMGSTVITLMSRDGCDGFERLARSSSVFMGRAIGRARSLEAAPPP